MLSLRLLSLKRRLLNRKEGINMVLSDLDMMVECILMAMEDHGCRRSDGHWLTAEEVITMPENEVISLFNQIYGRD